MFLNHRVLIISRNAIAILLMTMLLTLGLYLNFHIGVGVSQDVESSYVAIMWPMRDYMPEGALYVGRGEITHINEAKISDYTLDEHICVYISGAYLYDVLCYIERLNDAGINYEASDVSPEPIGFNKYGCFFWQGATKDGMLNVTITMFDVPQKVPGNKTEEYNLEIRMRNDHH